MQAPERPLLRWVFIALLAVSAGAGCGGINGSYSASPASFFLPGLMKADPPAEPTDPALPAAPADPLFAQAR